MGAQDTCGSRAASTTDPETVRREFWTGATWMFGIVDAAAALQEDPFAALDPCLKGTWLSIFMYGYISMTVQKERNPFFSRSPKP